MEWKTGTHEKVNKSITKRFKVIHEHIDRSALCIIWNREKEKTHRLLDRSIEKEINWMGTEDGKSKKKNTRKNNKQKINTEKQRETRWSQEELTVS